MAVLVSTGSDAYVGPSEGIDSDLFGFRYSGYRSFARFEEQTAESHIGIIGWPGGHLVEHRSDIFGLEYADTGLANPDSSFPSVGTIMQFASDTNHGIAITIPTIAWLSDLEGMRQQLTHFAGKLLSGAFGPVPDNVIIEIGSEYYGHAVDVGLTPDQLAPAYGRLAAEMIETLRDIEANPAFNTEGVDLKIAVQAGRDPSAAGLIIDGMPDEALAQVDLLIMSRMPLNFGGIDRTMDDYHQTMDVWSDAIVDAGGDAPNVFMTSFNVASPTRDEALNAFVDTMADAGSPVDPADIDLDDRTNAAFEQFWQDRIDRFDLGLDQPKMLMEIFSEFHEMGMTSGTAFGVDQLHPGRLSFEDVSGTPVSMLGMDFLNMLYESVDDTRLLEVSVTNRVSTQNPVYGFEGQDHTTIFVMGGDNPGKVELQIEGLSQDFTKAYVDTLTPVVPSDWMDRYGIPDNPEVDESPEGETYAEGINGTQTPEFRNGNMVVSVTAPGQVIRIVLTHSAEAEADVEEWVNNPAASVDLVAEFTDGTGGPVDPDDPPPPDDGDPDGEAVSESGGGDGGIGMIFLLLLPLLALAGMG